MLLEKLGKGGDRDIECVRAIVLLQAPELRRARDALGFLESLDLRRRVGVDKVL